MKNDKLNVFGEPDDIKQALYSSWEEFEEAQLMITKRLLRFYDDGTTEQEFLASLAGQLTRARNMIEEFAPNYHDQTREGWAQGAAEMSHP